MRGGSGFFYLPFLWVFRNEGGDEMGGGIGGGKGGGM